MADDWDSEDFVPKAPTKVKDSWEDEEVEAVKESWEDEDKPAAPKPKAEKKPEAKKSEPEKKKSEVAVADMTEEEKKKAQEETDLKHTTELFGLDKSLDDITLNSLEESVEYANRLYSRLNKFHNKGFYQDFLEELFRSLCKNLPADSVRKLSNSFKAFSDAKSAQEKAAKQAEAKAKVKPTIKAKAKNEVKGDINDFLKDNYSGPGYADDYDENEDFM